MKEEEDIYCDECCNLVALGNFMPICDDCQLEALKIMNRRQNQKDDERRRLEERERKFLDD